MRDLYPSAHHDRFVHSIGTYYIGRLMGEQIKQSKIGSNDVLNDAAILNAPKPESVSHLDSIIKNFKAACLLHDCGHAPFSHTFEHFFKQVKGYEHDMMKVAIEYIAKQICKENVSYYKSDEIEKVLNDYFTSAKFDKEVRAYLSDVKGIREEIGKLKEVQGSSAHGEIESVEKAIKEKEEKIKAINEDRTKLVKSVYVNYDEEVKKRLPQLNNNDEAQRLFLLLLEYFIDSSYQSPKPHERVSAWLVLHEKGFGEVLQTKMHLDPLLMARMICGYKYMEFDKPTYGIGNKSGINRWVKEILNCFISLLNGVVIDADKLDYCLRDKWASGMNVNNIDLNKLLHGLSIRVDDKVAICFSKGAIPEIESVMDSKNKVSFWCHNHNKIVYRQELLKNAVEKLAVVFASKHEREEYQYLKKCRHELMVKKSTETNKLVYDDNWHFLGNKKGTRSLKDYFENRKDSESQDTIFDFIKKRRGVIEENNVGRIFDYHSFITPQQVTVNLGQNEFQEQLSLISDDDVMCLLKKFLLPFGDKVVKAGKNDVLEKAFINDASKYVKDLFSRNQDLIPLWKSRAEFLSDFKELILQSEAKTLGDDNKSEMSNEEKIEKRLETVIGLIKKDPYKKLNDEEIPCRVISREMTVAGIPEDEIFIDTGGNKPSCYTKLDLLSKAKEAKVSFVYAFVPKIIKDGKEEPDWSKNRDIYLKILKDTKG